MNKAKGTIPGWNQKKEKTPLFQWFMLTVLLALLAYLFSAL
ncbi:MAG: hypothetical protein Q9M30_10440 [Mariprofundaceae bacterium]|nr:hypothetical protein [Mariprofundaceae bacterium]